MRQGGAIKGAAFWQYIQTDQARLLLIHMHHRCMMQEALVYAKHCHVVCNWL